MQWHMSHFESPGSVRADPFSERTQVYTFALSRSSICLIEIFFTILSMFSSRKLSYLDETIDLFRESQRDSGGEDLEANSLRHHGAITRQGCPDTLDEMKHGGL